MHTIRRQVARCEKPLSLMVKVSTPLVRGMRTSKVYATSQRRERLSEIANRLEL